MYTQYLWCLYNRDFIVLLSVFMEFFYCTAAVIFAERTSSTFSVCGFYYRVLSIQEAAGSSSSENTAAGLVLGI